MTNASKRKGDEFEWALVALGEDPNGSLAAVGLTVERTRAGYERDEGDLLVLTPDRQRLATLQAKNRRERKWSEWLAATETQMVTARARYSALVVKRNGIGDAGRSYAITTTREHLRLLADLHEAETRARVAEDLLTALRERGIEVPRLPEPGTLRKRAESIASRYREGAVVAAESPVVDTPAPVRRVRPFGPHGLNGGREQVPS